MGAGTGEDAVIDSWLKVVGSFPMESVHPLVVHFPIALLLTALLLDGAGLVFRRPDLHRLALWNLCWERWERRWRSGRASGLRKSPSIPLRSTR